MRDLPQRTLTAFVYAAIVLIGIFAPTPVFVVVLALIGTLALLELIGLRRAGAPIVLEFVLLVTGLASLWFLKEVAAFGYVLLMTIAAVWAADVAGYLVGSLVGTRKIVPRISPGKTWEGTLVGFLAAALVVAVANAPFVHLWWVVTAVLIGPVAFAGDLLESWLKRRAGVKDSGTLLPGHGGLLDRIDSLMAAAPLVAATIIYLGRMG